LASAPQWLKKTLLLFALTHQFLQQMIEGDELYTRVHKKVAPDESQGWTVVLMDRATRFIWDMHCGRKDRKMFKKAMGLLCQVIQQTGEGIRLRRDTLVSVMYAEGLNSAMSSVTLQSTDRHGILGQKSSGFQVPL
jgi:hypothetical protein